MFVITTTAKEHSEQNVHLCICGTCYLLLKQQIFKLNKTEWNKDESQEWKTNTFVIESLDSSVMSTCRRRVNIHASEVMHSQKGRSGGSKMKYMIQRVFFLFIRFAEKNGKNETREERERERTKNCT